MVSRKVVGTVQQHGRWVRGVHTRCMQHERDVWPVHTRFMQHGRDVWPVHTRFMQAHQLMGFFIWSYPLCGVSNHVLARRSQ